MVSIIEHENENEYYTCHSCDEEFTIDNWYYQEFLKFEREPDDHGIGVNYYLYLEDLMVETVTGWRCPNDCYHIVCNEADSDTECFSSGPNGANSMIYECGKCETTYASRDVAIRCCKAPAPPKQPIIKMPA